MIRGYRWLATVKNAVSGLAMTATPDRFWGAFGDGMRAGARAGKAICALCQTMSACAWLKSTILSALSDMKAASNLENRIHHQRLIRYLM
jgi:hypothetical protein